MALITVMGPIGVGKTVQAQRVAKELGWVTFSTGQLLRDLNDPEVSAVQAKGEAVPWELTARLVLSQVKNHPEDSIILDGSPRLPEEAAYYHEHGYEFDRVIWLEAPLDVLHNRLQERGRFDDTPDGIASRMGWYTDKIVPILEGYEDQGIVSRVDGHGSVEEVTQRIIAALKEADLV